MARSSIRQPLVVYAVVLALLISLAVLVFGGLALSRASHRAYRRAVRQELMLFARAGILPSSSEYTEVQLGVISKNNQSLNLSLEEARSIALDPTLEPSIVVIPIGSAAEEAYLGALLPRTIPTSIALVELSRVMPPILLCSLLAAALMSYMVYRQLLPSLHALAEIAHDAQPKEEEIRPDAPNEIVEIAVRFKDTTRWLQEARERAEQQRDELKQMQSNLLRASKLASVGRLAAGIAHELGNPLAAVKGYLSLMRQELAETERRDILERSIRELDRMHTIIRKLLTYARTGSEVSSIPELFELNHNLNEALQLAQGHTILRDVQFINEVPNDGLLVIGRPGQVGQVLINLFLNAGQAMRNKDRKQIRIVRTVETHRVTLEVKDSGPGIPKEHAESVFDPFFTTKAPGEGTGLGLPVSRAMMEAMGGSLELLSNGENANFALRIPLPAQSFVRRG